MEATIDGQLTAAELASIARVTAVLDEEIAADTGMTVVWLSVRNATKEFLRAAESLD